MDIKDVNFNEIAAIHGTIKEFNPENAAFFADRCAGKRHLALGAYIDGKPAGYTLAYDRYNDGSFYCWMGGVAPAFRQNGVYSALAREREKWARGQGFTALRIKTRNNRREMLHWLIKNGFDVIDIDKRTPPGDSRLSLLKRLDD